MAQGSVTGYNRIMSATLFWFFVPLLALTFTSVAATGLVIRILKTRNILDHPVKRSSHSVPTPRGGGIAVVIIIVTALFAWSEWSGTTYFPGPKSSGIGVVLLATIVLAIASWIDDLRSISPATRLMIHLAVVLGAIAWISPQGMFLQGLLPSWYDMIAVAILWLWFVNLFNFMDGIDGISGVEATSVSVGIALVEFFSPNAGISPWPSAAIAAVSIGFLWWNWQPARIFLGDVGSVPLGFLIGWLLIEAASAGLWAPALILPLYYLADATITLGLRILRREKIWEAHREHFYQIAVRGGRNHSTVSLAVLATNIALIFLALASLKWAWSAIIAAIFVVGALLLWMRRGVNAAST